VTTVKPAPVSLTFIVLVLSAVERDSVMAYDKIGACDTRCRVNGAAVVATAGLAAYMSVTVVVLAINGVVVTHTELVGDAIS
jgi:hypothetical protein